jgi:hypothetical protein
MSSKLRLRPIPLYIILGCGVIILLIGIYLSINHVIAYGITNGSKYFKGGEKIILNGLETIILGVAICAIPIYHLIKKAKEKQL